MRYSFIAVSVLIRGRPSFPAREHSSIVTWRVFRQVKVVLGVEVYDIVVANHPPDFFWRLDLCLCVDLGRQSIAITVSSLRGAKEVGEGHCVEELIG